MVSVAVCDTDGDADADSVAERVTLAVTDTVAEREGGSVVDPV